MLYFPCHVEDMMMYLYFPPFFEEPTDETTDITNEATTDVTKETTESPRQSNETSRSTQVCRYVRTLLRSKSRYCIVPT